MENLFEKGCLVQLSVRRWGGIKKIDKNRLAQMFESPEWMNATKKLVDPESLKPICKVGNAARGYLNAVSLPFPLQGMVFVPKEMISRVDERLDEFKKEFNQTVAAFIDDYDSHRETAMVYLGDLFSEIDYPVNIRDKFSLSWRFIILDVPNGNSGILAPEVYEREKEKFIRTMDEARELAIASLREEFAAMVERITERFAGSSNGKPRIFKNATVDGFYEYFETFRQRNIFKDEQLAELVQRAQDILGHNSADRIRSDQDIKNQIQLGMTEIESAMVEVFNRPRRKIVMD